MGSDFPLPRHELPTIKTTPREHEEAKELVDHMLAHTVLEFEKFVYRDKNHVDARIWKAIGSRDRLKVYKQREGGITHAVRTQRLDSMSELPSDSIAAATQPGSLMMSGYWPGKVENAMYAVVTKSQEELALVVIYLHEDVADCAILNTMEAPTADEPYRFLGYKFFVRKSPTNAHIVKNRDSLYLEYCGMTTTSQGERIGFHIMHSVDLPGFPDLKPRNSVRAIQSVRYIYRQKSENIVEIFMLGNMNISGTLGGLKPISSFFTADTLFGIARLVDCAEAKRLTDLVRARQQRIGLLQPKEKGTECTICRQRKKLFKTSSLTECTTCGQFVCGRCWLYKKIFVSDSDGILGKFYKVCVCKTCVLAANAGVYQEPRVHVNLARREHNSSRHRTESSVTGSYISSDSGSENSMSEERSASVYSSESAHSGSTQQAYYHTQFPTTHSDRGGGLHNRVKRAPSREMKYDPEAESMLYRPTLGDISSDLIPLEPVPSSPDNNMMMVLHGSHPPSSYDSRSISRTESVSSVASTRYFTPPTPTALPVGIPVGSYGSHLGSYPPSMRSASVASSSVAPSSRAPSSMTGTSVTSDNDIFMRMMELRRVAESTYNTTKENAAYMSMNQRY